MVHVFYMHFNKSVCMVDKKGVNKGVQKHGVKSLCVFAHPYFIVNILMNWV